MVVHVVLCVKLPVDDVQSFQIKLFFSILYIILLKVIKRLKNRWCGNDH